MPFLRQLRFFQRLIAAAEIGAGILPVAIEEQAVEPAVQIVVMRDVLLGARGWVVLVEPSFQPPQETAEPQDRQAIKVIDRGSRTSRRARS